MTNKTKAVEYVKADIDGKGTFLVGVLLASNVKQTTYEAADGSGPVTCPTKSIKPATKKDWEAQAHPFTATTVTSGAPSEAAPTAKKPTPSTPSEAASAILEMRRTNTNLKVFTPGAVVAIDDKAQKASARIGKHPNSTPAIFIPLSSTEAKGDTSKKLVNPDMAHYKTHKTHKTSSGRRPMDIADEVANLLRGRELDDCFVVTVKFLRAMGVDTISRKKTPVSVDSLKARYASLNAGMQRMNLGNILRNGMKMLDIDVLPVVK